jgi:hypothetical protein
MMVWKSFHDARPSSALQKAYQNICQFTHSRAISSATGRLLSHRSPITYFSVSFPNFGMMTSPCNVDCDVSTWCAGVSEYSGLDGSDLSRKRTNVTVSTTITSARRCSWTGIVATELTARKGSGPQRARTAHGRTQDVCGMYVCVYVPHGRQCLLRAQENGYRERMQELRWPPNAAAKCRSCYGGPASPNTA